MAQDERSSTPETGALSEPDLVGAIEAPDIYIEGYQGSMVHNGVIKINAYVMAFDPASEQMKRRVVARLTMPMPSMIQIHDALGRLIEQLEKDGLIQRVEGGVSNDAK